jgi:hypothetical protein
MKQAKKSYQNEFSRVTIVAVQPTEMAQAHKSFSSEGWQP